MREGLRSGGRASGRSARILLAVLASLGALCLGASAAAAIGFASVSSSEDPTPLDLPSLLIDATALPEPAVEMEDAPLTPEDLITGSGGLVEVRRSNIVGAHLRRFLLPESERQVGVLVIEFRTHDWAEDYSNDGTDAGDLYPEGTLIDTVEADGRTSWMAKSTVGRIGVVVAVLNDSGAVEPHAGIEELRAAVAGAQAGRLPTLGDLPVASDSAPAAYGRRFGLLLGSGTALAIVGVAGLATLEAALRDGGARERRANRRARPQRSEHVVDLTLTLGHQRQRAGAAAWMRLGVVVSCTAMLIASTRIPTAVSIALVGVVLVVIEGARTLIRRGHDPHDLALAGGRTTVILAALGTAGSLGLVVLAAGMLAAAVIAMLLVSPILALPTAVPMAGLGIVALTRAPAPLRMARRLAQPDVRRSIEADRRAPVLLLRSFHDDHLEIRSHSGRRMSVFEQITTDPWVRFEEVVAWTLWRTGPVVAVGQPGTILQPLGAARDYFSDDAWQPAVKARMNECSVIACVAGRSPGVLWELSTIRAAGLLTKTIFVIPPDWDAEGLRARIRVLASALDLRPVALEPPTGRLPVVFHLDASGCPRLYVVDGRDDFAYASAISRAVEAVLKQSGTPLRRPAEQWNAPGQDVTDVLLAASPPTPPRRRRTVLHTVASALIGV